MNTNLNIDGAGQTTSPGGALKDMNDEQLKAAQKSRQDASGVSPKDGGSLTMPARWRGVVADRNNAWGDWTNYSFPIHDLAHANNAAARLAQSDVYSSAEKSKIQGRIESAQKKFKKTEGNTITVDSKLPNKITAQDLIKADQVNPDDTIKKSDVIQIVSSLVDLIYSIQDRCVQRDNGIVDAVNSFIEDHTSGHLPSLDNSQKSAIFKAAKIDDQIEVEKTPMNCDQRGIWASALPKDQAEKLNSIKISVK